MILSRLGNGLSNLNAASFKNMDANDVVFEKGSQNSMNRSILSEEIANSLQTFGGIDHAAPMGLSMANLLESDAAKDGHKTDVAILAIHPVRGT